VTGVKSEEPTLDPITAYDRDAAMFAERFEAIAADAVHASVTDLVPPGPGLGFDVGAGSGRDAAWLSSLGYEVVAVEPAAGMRREGATRHPISRIQWLSDRLPDLSATHRLGLAFDLVLVNAIWMHLPPSSRQRAFRKLITLLKPGAVLLISLRHGPAEPGSPQIWPTTASEIEGLSRAHGLIVVRSVLAPDRMGRPDISWTAMCLRLPDDGAGALPPLRGIILNDDKSSTYKLALLRAIARIADGTPGLAVERLDEDVVDIPLGLVALNWVRMFLPLVSSALPQRPRDAGADGLDFAKDGFRALGPLGILAQDLRIGAQFSGERAQAVSRALAEARSTIARMPANFIRYPNSEARVFSVAPTTAPRPRDSLLLDGSALTAFGEIALPGHVWRAMQRLGAWIEPVLVSEWSRMMREYGERMGRYVSPGVAEASLSWLEPTRDTGLARQRAHWLIETGVFVRCVWTGARLKSGGLDIDHCLPWSAWPCGDLWNLFPATREVNQHRKRDRLPSAAALAAAHDEIIEWWTAAWQADPALSRRFHREAAAALPIAVDPPMEDIFAGLEWRRLRLRQDQQVEEWRGVTDR
jgi:protein-L-isoaspartate O-methyltransferase